MDNDQNIIGVIYPLPKNLIDRIDKSKNIFIKYLPRVPTRKSYSLKIREGIKLYIYRSGHNKTIVTEAIIDKVELLFFDEIISKYKNRTIAPYDELIKYVQDRENKKLLVLHLKNIKKYDNPLKVKVPITMAGRYITNENKNDLIMF